MIKPLSLNIQQNDTITQDIPVIKVDRLKDIQLIKPEIKQLDSVRPAYLRNRPRIQAQKPPVLSKKDSIQLNLILPEKHPDGYLIDNPLSRFLTRDKITNYYVNPGAKRSGDILKKGTAIDTETLHEGPDSIIDKRSDSVVLKDVSDTLFKESVQLPQPKVRNISSPLNAHKDWLSGLLLLSVIGIGLLRISSYKFLKELFNAAIYFQAANKMYSSINIRNSKPAFSLSVLFFLNTGIFIFEIFAFYGHSLFNHQGFFLLIVILGSILAYGAIKFFLYKLVGSVFNTSSSTGEYLFNSSLLSKVFGILLLPIIILIPFVNFWVVPGLIKIGIGLFIIIFFIQLLRGARIILQKSLSIFYMFLYFCALEILPLAILYKILV